MKLVEISDVFSVNYGVNLDLNKLSISESKESIPFVSRSSKNNGVSAFVELIDGITPNPKHTLSVAGGGSVLETFYQKESYYSGRDLYFLLPLIELSEKEMLVYATFIKANKYRYNFGRQANKTLGSIKIPHYDEVKKIAKTLKVPIKPTRSCVRVTNLSLNDREWNWFIYDELFKIRKGKRLTQADMEDGLTPFIGAIEYNNGLSKHINKKAIFSDNTITVSYNGSIAEAFYQPRNYWASDDINVLECKKKMNPFIAMFLSTIIKKEKYRYNYGRKWHKARMEKSKIKLPIDQNGNPDWQFMEDYIKSLPYSANIRN